MNGRGAAQVTAAGASAPAPPAGGRVAAAMALHGFRTLLRDRPPGARVALRVRQAGALRTIRLVLRDLV